MLDLVNSLVQVNKISIWLFPIIVFLFFTINHRHFFDLLDAVRKRKISQLQEAINSDCISEKEKSYLKDLLRDQLFSAASNIQKEQQVRSLIIDLRENSAGRLTHADVCNTQGYLIQKCGELIVTDLPAQCIFAILNGIIAAILWISGSYFIFQSALSDKLSPSAHLSTTAFGIVLFGLAMIPLFFTKTYSSMRKIDREIKRSKISV